MAELFFILTVVFVAYVVFVVLGDKKSPAASHKARVSQPEPAAASVSATVAESKPQPVKAVAAKPARPKPVPANTKSAETVLVSEAVAQESLKNPKTGEISKIPGNYAFAKRWIKDALLEEGLLEKVYKNNELTDDVKLKIQEALQKLKAIDKYQ